MFEMALDYPVQVLNWSDRIAGPSLREARSKTSLCLMGGWNEQTLFGGDQETEIARQRHRCAGPDAGYQIHFVHQVVRSDELPQSRWPSRVTPSNC